MKLNQQIKSYAIVGVVGVSSLFLQSCSEEEVKNGLAILAVAAILADDSPTNNHDRGHDHDYDHDYDHDQWDDDFNHDDRRDESGRRRYYKQFSQITDVSLANMQQFAVKQVISERNKVEIIANKYNLSTGSAEKLQNALNKAQNRDYSGIDDIGILRSDVESLYENRKVTRYTLVNISAAMAISFEEAKVFVSSLQKDIQTAKTLVK